MKHKRYTIPIKNARLQISRGFGVGSKFLDHGRRMVITKLGMPYRDEREILQDFFAQEQPRSAEAKHDQC